MTVSVGVGSKRIKQGHNRPHYNLLTTESILAEMMKFLSLGIRLALRELVTHSPLKVLCNAFSNGLGAVLEQEHDGHLAYSSISLNKSEQNYCQLEKEV